MSKLNVKLLIILATIILPLTTFAKDPKVKLLTNGYTEAGNGGDAFKEPTQGDKLLLLDTIEHKNPFNPSNEAAYKEFILSSINVLASKAPLAAEFLKYIFTAGGPAWYFVEHAITKVAMTGSSPIDLTLFSDGQVDADPNTYKVQVAKTDIDTNEVFIVKEYWDQFSPEEKAFELLHEALQWAERSRMAYEYINAAYNEIKMSVDTWSDFETADLVEFKPVTTSQKIRVLTGFLLAKPTIEAKDVRNIFSTVRSNSAEVAGNWTFSSNSSWTSNNFRKGYYDWSGFLSSDKFTKFGNTYYQRFNAELIDEVALYIDTPKLKTSDYSESYYYHHSPLALLLYLDTVTSGLKSDNHWHQNESSLEINKAWSCIGQKLGQSTLDDMKNIFSWINPSQRNTVLFLNSISEYMLASRNGGKPTIIKSNGKDFKVLGNLVYLEVNLDTCSIRQSIIQTAYNLKYYNSLFKEGWGNYTGRISDIVSTSGWINGLNRPLIFNEQLKIEPSSVDTPSIREVKSIDFSDLSSTPTTKTVYFFENADGDTKPKKKGLFDK